MESPVEATPALKHNMAMQQLDKVYELLAMFQAHLGFIQKDTNDISLRNIFEEISRALVLSRDILMTKFNGNLLGSQLVTSQSLGSAETKKRKRDDKCKDSQKRKYNNKRTELTPMPHNDGYQWRKYGQKTILSKSYPRCYYRCAYQKDRKCMASKQVQQYNDEYPPLFEVNYFDDHTCNIVTTKLNSTINLNILDSSGNSIPESNLSANIMGCRRQDEEATLVSCLTNVITGYNSKISENSNGGYNALNTSIESSVSIYGDISSIEGLLFREDEFPVVHDITMDLRWLE